MIGQTRSVRAHQCVQNRTLPRHFGSGELRARPIVCGNFDRPAPASAKILPTGAMAQQTHKNLDPEPALEAVNTYFLVDPSLLSAAQQRSLPDGQLVERARYLSIDAKIFAEITK
jgi:hypothetical protein